MMQKPTVGRIVHYHYHKERDLNSAVKGPNAAMICYVLIDEEGDEQRVNLHVYPRWKGDSEGFFQGIPFSEEPKPGHWSWPPRV